MRAAGPARSNDRHGVSTAVMREAGRLLEHQRIVSMTRGRAGGLTIREPSAEAVARAIAIVFDFSGMSLGELLQVKALLEAWSARAAAQRITPQGLSRPDQAVSWQRRLRASHRSLIVATAFMPWSRRRVATRLP